MIGHSLLSLATAVLCCNLVDLVLFSRQPIWTRALWRVATLIVLTVLVSRIFGSPLTPRFRMDLGWSVLWQQAVVAGWWAAAARSAVGLARLLLFLQSRSRETQILSDLLGAAIYLATALAIVDRVFEVPVAGLLATSGVIAIVLGLALQSTLSDVFSGIAVDIERPYRAGDLVWVEGGIEGRVREVNWRSTHIATGNGDIAIVPNSVIAKARLVNYSLPAPVRSTTVEIRLDPTAASERCRAALDAALRACQLPLASPAPSVVQTGLHADGATYELTFSVPSSENLGAARTELFALVQRHLSHAGIALAVPGLPPQPSRPPPTPAAVLEGSDLFGAIRASERDLLAAEMKRVRLKAGDTLFRQDAAADALYVLAAGTLEVERREPDGGASVHRMSPGVTLGVIGLISGSTYAASATALTEVTAYRLDQSDIATAVDHRPELGSALEDLAEREQAALADDVAARNDRGPERLDLSVSRMRGFLRRLAAEASGIPRS